MSFVVLIVLIFVALVSFPVAQGNNQAAFVAVFVFLGSAFAVYSAPAWIAARRNHPKVAAIAILDFFAGWTLIGWIVALVWAYTDGRDSEGLAAVEPRKCPFCAERINPEAIKCRYCGSDLPENASRLAPASTPASPPC